MMKTPYAACLADFIDSVSLWDFHHSLPNLHRRWGFDYDLLLLANTLSRVELPPCQGPTTTHSGISRKR